MLLIYFFLLDWVKFYHQKWVIASLNNCISKIDDNIWKMSPDNTNIAEAAHALSNSRGKNLKLVTAILQYVNILVTNFLFAIENYLIIYYLLL